MSILTKDTPRLYDPAVEPIFADIPGKISTTVYEGAAVTDDGSGGECDGLLAASEGFLGFVERGVITNATTSDINVRIRQKGVVKDLAVTGLDADTDYGVAVYASDNATFSLTSTSTSVQIGKVQGYKGVSGYGDVYFEAAAIRSI